MAVLIYAASQSILYWPALKIQNRIDDRHFAYRYRQTGAPHAEHDNIIIVDLDDRTMKSLGSIKSKRWPRHHMANVIDRLRDDGARLIYLDILFQDWTRDNDTLANAAKNAGNIIAGYYFDLDWESRFRRPDDSVINETLTESISEESAEDKNSRFIQSQRVVLPYYGLVKNVRALGFANYIPDPDGILRHVPLYISSGKNGSVVSASAALQMWLILNGIDYHDAKLSPDGVRFNGSHIPTDKHCFMRLNYHDAGSVYPYISFVDVLDGKFQPGFFNGKIVMLGSSSEKAGDLKTIPGNESIPGVEVHAIALSTLMNGQFIRVISGNSILILSITSGLLAGLIFPLLPLTAGSVIALLYPIALFSISRALFMKSALLLNIVIPSFIVFLLFIVFASHELFERFEKAHESPKT